MRTAALSTIGITAIVCCIGCSTTADSQSNFANTTAQSNNASSGSTATSATTTTAPAGQETGATDARGGEGDGTRAAPLANGGPGPATAGGGGANGGLALGGDADHPVPRCGPRDSYFFVATEFRCPDGTNPLNGDIAAGQRARAGNVGANNTTGHIIDLYTVPCASGPQRVYVDMYGCPQYASMFGGP